MPFVQFVVSLYQTWCRFGDCIHLSSSTEILKVSLQYCQYILDTRVVYIAKGLDGVAITSDPIPCCCSLTAIISSSVHTSISTHRRSAHDYDIQSDDLYPISSQHCMSTLLCLDVGGALVLAGVVLCFVG